MFFMIHRYPRRLLPKHNNGIISECCIRDMMKDFFLLRRVKYNAAIPLLRDRIRDQFLPSTFKKGISVVLLSVFRKGDIHWCCRKPYGKKKHYEDLWVDSNRKALYPKNKYLQYERKKASFGGYKIQDIYEYESDFPTTVNDKRGYEKVRHDVIRLKVVHEPTCINYWHCEIMLYRLNGDDKNKQEKLSNKEMERAGNLIIDDLTDMVYEGDDVKCLYLEKKYYKRKC